MKKLLLAVPVILAFSSCSSAPAQTAAVPDIPFSANAGITYNGAEFTAEVWRSAPGKWELTVTEPYTLEGLKMELCGDETRLSLLGIEAAADVGNDAVSAAKAIASAYDAVAGQQGTFTADANGYTMTGTCPLGSVTVVLADDGTPLAFSCDTAGLSVELSGFEKLPETDIEAEIVE